MISYYKAESVLAKGSINKLVELTAVNFER